MSELHFLGLLADHYKQDESEHHARQYKHFSVG